MAYHQHNPHGQFPGSAAPRFAQHPQPNNNQIQGLAQQHTQQQQQQQQQQTQQQYATHLQHHNPNSGNFGINALNPSSSYKLDNTRESRQGNGLQGYSSMPNGSWNNPTDITGFGQTHSSGQLSQMLAHSHHSTSQPSLPMPQYSQPQPQQPQQQQQQQHQQHQQQQQQAFLFTHNQSPTHLRAAQPQQPQQPQQQPQQPQQQPQQQQPAYGSHHSSGHQGAQHFSSAVVSPASQLSRQQQQPPAQASMVGSGLKPAASLGGVNSVGRGYLDSALSTGPNPSSFGPTNNFGMATSMPNLRNAYGGDDEGGSLIPNDDNPLEAYPPLNGNPHSNQANRYQAPRPANNPVTPGRLAHDMRPGAGGHILNNNPTALSQSQPLSSYDQRTATQAMTLKGDVMLGGGGVAGGSTQHQQSSRHLSQALPQSPYSSYHSTQQSPQQPYPSPHASILPQSQHQHPHQQATPPGQSAITPKESPQLPAPKTAIVEPEKKKQPKAPKAAAGAKKVGQGKKNSKAQLDNVPSPETGRVDAGSSHAMASAYNSVDSSVTGHNRMYSNPLTP
ncbi:hypothetical protein BGX26_005152, partial [Mortierella sp. AD094]